MALQNRSKLINDFTLLLVFCLTVGNGQYVHYTKPPVTTVSQSSYRAPKTYMHFMQSNPFYLPTNDHYYVPYPAPSVNGFPYRFGQNVSSSPVRCGDYFPKQCVKSRYRTYDGSCNNLQNPTWGMANTRYGRLLRANYGDGISAPTRSTKGTDLPYARLVSYTMFPPADVKDSVWSLVAMQYGQIMAHDMGLIDGSAQATAHSIQCCTMDGDLKPQDLQDPLCYPMLIPPRDPVYTGSGINCLNFVRSTTDRDRGCSFGSKPAEQLNIITHYLDLSLVYGSDDQTAASLRAGIGGRLIVDYRDHREWPPAAPNKTTLCDVVSEEETCYLTGDSRANQNPQLAIIQVLLLREHNRVADALSRLNPHWTDETTFQEARRIVTAEHQQISYYEWLPVIIGVQAPVVYKIFYDTKGYVNDYDPTVDPSTLNEFSTAAFRYFHTLIAGYLKLFKEPRYSVSAARLSDWFNRPQVIEQDNNFDDLTRGLATQPQQESDQYFDREITNYLFRNGRRLGSDLRATDIHRSRDHGLASYNSYRQLCGLKKAIRWSDFSDQISAENIQKLAQLYDSPADVDVTVGASLERHIKGTIVGHTFMCILVEQFYRTRVGDRFWYESGDPEVAFTLEQLGELRKASISRLMCDNSDHITNMQQYGFLQVTPVNPLMSCDDLPKVDLSLWKDYSLDVRTTYPYYKKKK
ncbi:peroxidase-like isoform X2 [Prorops nasuta]